MRATTLKIEISRFSTYCKTIGEESRYRILAHKANQSATGCPEEPTSDWSSKQLLASHLRVHMGLQI